MKRKLHYITAKQISPGAHRAPAWFCVSAQDASGLLHCVNIPIEDAGTNPDDLENIAKKRGLVEIEAYLDLLSAYSPKGEGQAG